VTENTEKSKKVESLTDKIAKIKAHLKSQTELDENNSKLKFDLDKREEQIEKLQILVSENNELKEEIEILKNENFNFQNSISDEKEKNGTKEKQVNILKEGMKNLEDVKLKNNQMEETIRKLFLNFHVQNCIFLVLPKLYRKYTNYKF